MKRIKSILPYVLAVVIIFEGYFSMEGIKALIPSNKEIIKVFEKPEQNNLFYMGTSDELIIYPWDVINEKNSLAFNEYFTEEVDEKGVSIKDEILESISFLDRKIFIPDFEKFEPNIRYDGQQETIFVKDYVYQNTAGVYCMVNFAKKFDEVIYFHCEELNQTDLTLDEAQSANWKINDYLVEFHNSDGTLVEELIKSNALLAFYHKNPVPWCYGTPMIVKQKNELLLIYQFVGLQVVLYYNPKLDLISGFGVKQ